MHKQPAMKMSRCLSASILLMLSLEAALLVAGVDMGTIRFPSDAQGDARQSSFLVQLASSFRN